LTLLRIVLAAAGILLLLPTLVLFAEVLLASLRPRRGGEGNGRGPRPRLAVVVPAHDEQAGIADTLHGLLPQLRQADRLVVVADNCSDDTAKIAAAEGAEVLVRQDPVRRGKGFALDAAIRHLAADAPEIVVIVDADCRVRAGTLDLLARRCCDTQRPVQALYLMRSPPAAGPLTKVAEFAWIVKNRVRPLGLHRAGLPCQLMGTGMAFPWACIRGAHLASGNIVEDVQLGFELASAGTPPLFEPQACVLSMFPTSPRGLHSQRTRWEHGHLAIALFQAPRLLARAMRVGSPALAALALDLCIPPLALLLLGALALWVLSLSFYQLSGQRLPTELATVELLLLGASVLLAWARYGRQTIALKHLALALLYAVWKVPLYARFFVNRQAEWIRSKRD